MIRNDSASISSGRRCTDISATLFGQALGDPLHHDLGQLVCTPRCLPSNLDSGIALAGLIQLLRQVFQDVGTHVEEVGHEQDALGPLRHAGVDALLDVGEVLFAEGRPRRSRNPSSA